MVRQTRVARRMSAPPRHKHCATNLSQFSMKYVLKWPSVVLKRSWATRLTGTRSSSSRGESHSQAKTRRWSWKGKYVGGLNAYWRYLNNTRSIIRSIEHDRRDAYRMRHILEDIFQWSNPGSVLRRNWVILNLPDGFNLNHQIRDEFYERRDRRQAYMEGRTSLDKSSFSDMSQSGRNGSFDPEKRFTYLLYYSWDITTGE